MGEKKHLNICSREVALISDHGKITIHFAIHVYSTVFRFPDVWPFFPFSTTTHLSYGRSMLQYLYYVHLILYFIRKTELR